MQEGAIYAKERRRKNRQERRKEGEEKKRGGGKKLEKRRQLEFSICRHDSTSGMSHRSRGILLKEEIGEQPLPLPPPPTHGPVALFFFSSSPSSPFSRSLFSSPVAVSCFYIPRPSTTLPPTVHRFFSCPSLCREVKRFNGDENVWRRREEVGGVPTNREKFSWIVEEEEDRLAVIRYF